MRDMILQVGAIVTVCDPKVKESNAFAESKDHDTQVDASRFNLPTLRRKHSMNLMRLLCSPRGLSSRLSTGLLRNRML